VLVLAAALRSFRLGSPGLWLDEAVSWIFARASWAELLDLLRLDSGPPLYYALLGLWTRSWGDSAVALRSFSVVAGLLGVTLLFFVGRRLFGERTGLAAALLLAVVPIQIRHAQEARAYTLLAFLGLGAMFALLAWVDGGGKKWLALHVVLFAAVLYTHNYGFFLLVAGMFFAAVEGGRQGGPGRPSWKLLGRALAGFPLVALLYLPWLPTFLFQLAHEGPYAWMRLAWEERGLAGTLGDSLRALSPGGGGPPYLGLPALPWGGVATLLTVALLAWGLFRLARWWKFGPGPQAPGGLAPRGTALWLFAYLFVPPVAAALYSVFRAPIYLPGRLDQLVIPAFCLVLAVGLEGLRPEAVRVGGLGLFALASLLALRPLLLTPGRATEKELAAEIEAHLAAGDAVVATGLSWAPLSHALREGVGAGLVIHPFPAEITEHPGNEDLDALLADPARLEAEADALLARLIPVSGPAEGGRPVRRQVFLAFVPDRVHAILLNRLRTWPPLAAFEALGAYEQRLVGQEIKLFRLEVEGR